MKIRELKIKDAPLMLEWMQNYKVTTFLNNNFASKTLKDCENFIVNSREVKDNLDLAVVDFNDEYMGTVSLKNVNNQDRYAEFAITMRYVAMGKGFSSYGMNEILKIGFEKMHLKGIYWCVSKENKRAIRFYNKNGYMKATFVPKEIMDRYDYSLLQQLIWYKEVNEQ